MKKGMKKDILITGFAMFAIFFGSGNLIFPPQIGLLAGGHVLPAIVGLALTGILFPMLAVAAVGNVGFGLEDMMMHVTPWWHYLYMATGLLVVVFGTIPRCGGVAYEAGLEGITGPLPGWARIVFLLIFFGISYYFAMNKSQMVDRIGEYLTPLLLVTLFIIIVMGFVKPIAPIEGGVYSSGGEAFINAFQIGYNTGDVGTGIVCAGIFISAFQAKGYTGKKEYKMAMTGIIIVGFVLLFIVYGGLTYLGAQGTTFYDTNVDTTFLLMDLVRRLAGNVGTIILSLAIIFACLTTAIGMIGTTGGWVESWSKGKIPYNVAALVITIGICLISSTGVANVLTISGPLFMFIFPMSVVMMVLGLCKRFVPNDGTWKGAVITSAVMAVFDSISVASASGLLPIDVSGLMNIIYKIPFAEQGFAWLIPTLIGLVVGTVYYKVTGKESKEYVV